MKRYIYLHLMGCKIGMLHMFTDNGNYVAVDVCNIPNKRVPSRKISDKTKATLGWLPQADVQSGKDIFSLFVGAFFLATSMIKTRLLSVLHVTMSLTANHRVQQLDIRHARRVQFGVVEALKFNWLLCALKQLVFNADKNAKASIARVLVGIKGVNKLQLFSY